MYGFRRELISELIRLGHKVIAFTPFDQNVEDLRNLGIHLEEIKMDRRGVNPIKDFALIKNYWKMLHQEKPDLVITYTIKPNIYGGIVSIIMQIPYAENITGLGSAFQKDGFLKKIVITLYKIAIKKAKVVFLKMLEIKTYLLKIILL